MRGFTEEVQELKSLPTSLILGVAANRENVAQTVISLILAWRQCVLTEESALRCALPKRVSCATARRDSPARIARKWLVIFITTSTPSTRHWPIPSLNKGSTNLSVCLFVFSSLLSFTHCLRPPVLFCPVLISMYVHFHFFLFLFKVDNLKTLLISLSNSRLCARMKEQRPSMWL